MAKQRFQPKPHIKKGDTVMVISGDHKGQKGEVTKVLVDENRAIVEGVNMVKRHRKASADQPAGIVEMEAPIHISNLMHLDPKSGEPTRIGRRVEGDKIVRYSKKSNEVIK
jgi:large subunit ribosomal protein L24